MGEYYRVSSPLEVSSVRLSNGPQQNAAPAPQSYQTVPVHASATSPAGYNGNRSVFSTTQAPAPVNLSIASYGGHPGSAQQIVSYRPPPQQQTATYTAPANSVSQQRSATTQPQYRTTGSRVLPVNSSINGSYYSQQPPQVFSSVRAPVSHNFYQPQTRVISSGAPRRGGPSRGGRPRRGGGRGRGRRSYSYSYTTASSLDSYGDDYSSDDGYYSQRGRRSKRPLVRSVADREGRKPSQVYRGYHRVRDADDDYSSEDSEYYSGEKDIRSQRRNRYYGRDEGDSRPPGRVLASRPGRAIVEPRDRNNQRWEQDNEDFHDHNDTVSRQAVGYTPTLEQVQYGIYLFNEDTHAKGIKYLQDCRVISYPLTPESVANFFRTYHGISRQAIGEYLGKPDDFNQQALAAYMSTFDLRNQHILDALREFLSHVRIPGESQIVGRFMDSFGEAYFPHSPHGLFADKDAVTILCYSIMMLNTDLYNRQLKKKKRMSQEEWLRNNRGINGGKDYDEGFLLDIYNSVKANEIQMTKGEYT